MSRFVYAGRRRTPRGIVLILVLVVLVLLSLAAYTFSDLMLTERDATLAHGEQAQARSLVASGVEMARVYLSTNSQARAEAGGHFDNPLQFQGMLVLDDEEPQLRGRFTVVAPAPDGFGSFEGIRFGLENESARINLNALLKMEGLDEAKQRELLMAMPGVSEEVADAVLDWIDEDDEPREYGAELEYYTSLNPPYAPKNGPIDTVEELLLVRGVTPELLFGVDANRNAMVDSYEQQAALTSTTNGSAAADLLSFNGLLDRGLSAFLTLYSAERNVNSSDQPRINVNGDDMEQLHADLSAVMEPDWATFIVAYRQNGAEGGGGGAPSRPEPVNGREVDLTQPAQNELADILDLVGAQVEARLVGQTQPTLLESPFPDDPEKMREYLPILMEYLTVKSESVFPARININEAPAAVLMAVLTAVPNMTDAEQKVEQIVSMRDVQSPSDTSRAHPTWLLTEGIVNRDQMKALMPFVTTRGDVFRAQVIGYYDGGGVWSRAEVVLDATIPLPRVLFWRELGHLGRGFPRDVLGADVSRR